MSSPWPKASAERPADRRVHWPGRVRHAFAAGDHGSTSAQPGVVRAALAVLNTIEAEGILANVTKVGAQLTDGSPPSTTLAGGVRGSGLWARGRAQRDHSARVAIAARERGFLVNARPAGRDPIAPR